MSFLQYRIRILGKKIGGTTPVNKDLYEKKKPIVSVTYENERIHCYFCLPTSPELGFPVFSGFCFRVDLCNGKLNGFMFHWSPLLAALSSHA